MHLRFAMSSRIARLAEAPCSSIRHAIRALKRTYFISKLYTIAFNNPYFHTNSQSKVNITSLPRAVATPHHHHVTELEDVVQEHGRQAATPHHHRLTKLEDVVQEHSRQAATPETPPCHPRPSPRRPHSPALRDA